MPDDFYWRESWWLILVLLPWLIILLRYFMHRKIWLKIADTHLLSWVKADALATQNYRSHILLAIAWLFFAIALAGPRTPQWIPPALQSEDAVIVIVDFSTSMRAVEHSDKRIVQAQQVLQHWLKQQVESPARKIFMGLMIYSGQSHSLLIPTDDHSLYRYFISQLDQFSPPTLGNNLAASLQSASEQLKKFRGKQSIIVISDGDLGEKALSSALLTAAQIKQDNVLKLSVIGVGQSEPVTIPLENGKKFSFNNKVIVSRRETLHLQQLADVAGGAYFKAEFLTAAQYQQLISISEPHIDAQSIIQVLWYEWFFIPLVFGMLFTFLGLYRFKSLKKSVALVSVILLLAACGTKTEVHDYHKAFLKGVDCYRAHDYICAQQSFAYAAWTVKSPILRGRAVFNLANSHFKLGDYELASILFQDAQYYGVATDKTRINREFADSLAAAVRQRWQDFEKIRQHIQWSSSAPELPDGFADMLADGLYRSQKKSSLLSSLSNKEQQLLLQRGIRRKLSQSTQLASSGAWVSAKQDKIAQSTAGLFNSLMPIESGLHYVPDTPLEINGVRPW